MIELPTEMTEACKTFEDYNFIIYGPSDVGKTTFCLQAEDNLVIDGGGGLKGFKCFKYPPEKDRHMTKWSEFVEFVDVFLAGNHEYKVITIDEADNLFDLCLKWTLWTEGRNAGKENGYESISEMGRGGYAWGDVNTNYLKPFRKLIASRYRVQIVSHSKIDEVKDVMERKTKKETMLYGESCREKLKGMVDVVLYAEMDGTGKSWLKCARMRQRDVKIRGLTPDQRAKFKDVELNYGTFKAMFEKGLRREL